MLGNPKRGERGQALVLVVVAMVVLIGITGLAIDGGNVYSDRRHAQNAADTSAMAAGLTKIRNPAACATADPVLCTIAANAGYARATDNGYTDNGASTLVDVYQCSDPGATCNLPSSESYTDENSNGVHDASEPFTDRPPYNGMYDEVVPRNYVQVKITSIVPTYLGRILGITQMTNTVEAIARAVPQSAVPLFGGKALVALMPGCKADEDSWPNDPFTVTGGSVSLITGAGGVMVNSDCDNAFTAQNNASISSTSGFCVVGGTDIGELATVFPDPITNCGPQVDIDFYQPPAVSEATHCDPAQPGLYFDMGGGTILATPGYYPDSFPRSGVSYTTLKLAKGIYCLNNGISVSGTGTITTDRDDVGEIDGSDGAQEGVLLYVPNGAVTFNGTSLVKIGAMNGADVPVGLRGYLIYLPPSNDSTVTLTGSNGSTFVGIVLAPSSLVTLKGGASGDHLQLETQIIGYSLEVTGGGVLDVEWNQGSWNTAWTHPLLVLYR